MSFKKTFRALAATKLAICGITVLFFAFCFQPEAEAQKTKPVSTKAAPETPGRLSLSGEPDVPGYTWPEWLLSPPPVPHGIGVAAFWKSDSMRSYREARLLAIQDLNASDRLIVTIETAVDNKFPFLISQEFAIDERYSEANSILVDSVVIDKRLYYLVTGKPVEVNRKGLVQIPEKPVWVDAAEPSGDEELWEAGGKYKIFMYTKQNSWIRAKQDALAKLSQFVSLRVQTNQKLLNESFSNTTYIKSRVLVEDVLVSDRWSDGVNYYVRLRVMKAQIKALN